MFSPIEFLGLCYLACVFHETHFPYSYLAPAMPPLLLSSHQILITLLHHATSMSGGLLLCGFPHPTCMRFPTYSLLRPILTASLVPLFPSTRSTIPLHLLSKPIPDSCPNLSYLYLASSLIHHMLTQARTNHLKPCVFLASFSHPQALSQNVAQALKNPVWHHAIDGEYNALFSNHT